MNQQIKSLVLGLLTRARTYPTRATDREALESLVRSLHPRRPAGNLVRLGPDGDGGYLVPEDLEGIEACFSPGVSDISGFEVACADRGMKVFLADRTVDGPAEANPAFSFTKKFVGAIDDDGFMTLAAWVREAGVDSAADLMLQMDIEGFEYEALISAPEDLIRRFRVMVIEFHDLEKLLSKPFFRFASLTFKKLLKSHHCVHIHPNNDLPTVSALGFEIPPLLEMTFWRKDRAGDLEWATTFPHPLDRDNTGRASFALPSTWYRSAPTEARADGAPPPGRRSRA